jgi:hypothetical protein
VRALKVQRSSAASAAAEAVSGFADFREDPRLVGDAQSPTFPTGGIVRDGLDEAIEVDVV